MKPLVEALCSDACGGRAPGTPGGAAARALVRDALRAGGLDPFDQEVPGCKGGNVLATIPGERDRWILVGAHHDHLGTEGGRIYRGADDNAAAVAVLVQVAAGLARQKPAGRGVIIASFDAEEPPWFMTESMGSEHFARNPTVPLESIDLAIVMDLVGHALGLDAPLPDEVRQTVFALGAERSAGTAARVDLLAEQVAGVRVRRTDAEVIPPLSDHDAFWRRSIPFILLTCGRTRIYHTPNDVPSKLDYAKMGALAVWLERFVRDACAREEPRFAFQPHARDDASTLRAFLAVARPIAPAVPHAAMGVKLAEKLLASCDASGRAPESARTELEVLVAALEQGLA